MTSPAQRSKYKIFTALLLLLFVSVQSQAAANRSYPCDYSHTVNISEGLRLKDGSYSYDGLLIPANMTALYNFQVVDGILSKVANHMRGCACEQRPCITFCCRPEQKFDEQTQTCVQQTEAVSGGSSQQQHTKYDHIEVTYANGSVNAVNIRDVFIKRYEAGCNRKYIDKHDEVFWKWDLFANGSLSTLGRIWSTGEFCFTPVEHKKVWSLMPLTCEYSSHGFRLWIYVISLFLAILIFSFALIILVSIKAVRNGAYGEALIFYLASTVIALSSLLYLALRSRWDLSEAKCRNLGFIAYVFFMISFFLLTIISWNFWYNFNSKRICSWKRKIIYMAAIAFAVTLRFLLKFIQDSNIYQQLKPGIGDKFCWFDVRLWGILLYYYIPIFICLGLSMMFFLQTYMAIWNLPEDTLNVAGYDIKLIKAHFHAFFAYLFCVLCVWIRELVVYLSFRFRRQYFILDFLAGICVLALSISALLFLLYKNPLVRAWWHTNVTFYITHRPVERPENGIYLQEINRSSEQLRDEEFKEHYMDEIGEEGAPLR
ncbi:probable G-protein coupled receptor Mth-like 9 [Eurosta solidaginis]|uniref:probable G-protein coupled receptor Mth-like 9 n=1 Tax=Eurosta solidaginis TaxID=178769 RepID=UPI00353098F2